MSVPEPGGGSLWLPERGEVCGCLWLLLSMASLLLDASGCLWLSLSAVAVCGCGCVWLSLHVAVCDWLCLSVAVCC